ncbi:MAG: hypothetical protein K9G49_13525 [Taibaiella sp.]|nr:hypothetical protein [Taibaiella sp.]
MADKVIIHMLEHKLEDAYGFFFDLNKFVSVHPVIYKCDLLAENSYLFYERLKFAGLSLSFSYKVVIEHAVPHTQVIMFSEIRKGVTLRLIFDFSESNGKTKLTETIIFTGPFFIKSTFVSFLEKMYLKMVDNMNKIVNAAV